mgnify:FL=1|tara:strand:- start:765 stop:953 length:189 start_codon:yes stop_codon:yes gene_type:complete
MINYLKELDKSYPYFLILFLFLLGCGLIYARYVNYIPWPNALGFVIVGESIYLFYKRYLKAK